MEAFPFVHQLLHTRRVDSPVMIWIQIRAMGVRGACSPGFFFKKKNGAIWRILSVPKYVIIHLKINNFKDNFRQ